MRLLVLICALVFLCDVAIAQQSTVFSNLFCKEPAKHVLFYNGDNILRAYLPKVEVKNLEFKTAEGLFIYSVRKENDSIYFNVSVARKITDAHINTYDKKTGKTIAAANFEIIEALQPYAKVGYIVDSFVSKETLLEQSHLITANDTKHLAKIAFPVIAYTFKTKLAGEEYVIPVKGGVITKEIKEIIKRLPRNARVDFAEIIARGVSGGFYGCGRGTILNDIKMHIQ
jgi:hypothetical protein